MIGGQKVVDHPATVFAHEVHHAERDSDRVGSGPRINDVLLPWAIAEDLALVDPVLHIGTLDRQALPLEKQGGNRAVDATRHGHEDPLHNSLDKSLADVSASPASESAYQSGDRFWISEEESLHAAGRTISSENSQGEALGDFFLRL